MHPDCPTVSPYRTPSKLQLRTLQARLALLSRFRRYSRASRKLPSHFTAFSAIMLTAPIVAQSRALPCLHALLDYEHRCAAVPLVCGNKARKLATLLDSASFTKLMSNGGGQSNAMLAIARLCAARGAEFVYHTKPLPKFLRTQPSGNLARALALGMTLVEHKTAASYDEACATLRVESGYVPQGAAYAGAEPGVAALAADIADWWQTQQQHSQQLSVVVPAGTGTTALFLARHAPPEVRVFAVPAVGGEAALLAQVSRLDAASGGIGKLPRVLLPPPRLSVAFGKPARKYAHTPQTPHGILRR